MSFIIEVSKYGKDTILYNNYKYRESYGLKSGDIVWRCLGKTCKASIKTDKDKFGIFSFNECHSGPHPVTMRAHTPTPPPKHCSPATTPGDTTLKEATPLSRQHLASESGISDTQQLRSVLCSSSPSPDLIVENTALKEELARLREELRVVLDHSIDSDQRLLQFTKDIFPPPTPLRSNPTAADLVVANIATQTDEYMINGPCQTCSILKEETRNMIESLRSLEEENKELKNRIHSSSPSKSATSNYQQLPPLPLATNRYSLLGDYEGLDDSRQDLGYLPAKNRKRNRRRQLNGKKEKHSRPKQETNNNKDVRNTKASLNYNSVTILGDSHVRHLAGMVAEKVKHYPIVTGICKPGAGLLNIKPAATPPTKNHCFVIMVGTNDVDGGREDRVYSYMEGLLEDCSKTSNVLVIPLTTRFDLQYSSPIHHTTRLLNNFLSELCCRMKGVEMLDIRRISRRHYTPHGLHLNKSGKSLLASLIVERLRGVNRRSPPRTQPLPDVSASRLLPSPGPTTTTMQLLTYAEATSGSISTGNSQGDPEGKVISPVQNDFLGQHTLVSLRRRAPLLVNRNS